MGDMGSKKVKPEQSSQQVAPLPPLDNPIPFPSKQASILSLTLDELRCKSGKAFDSMNMEEFLANLWTNPENHPEPAQLPPQPPFSFPNQLGRKTVDEVWFEIHPNQVQRDPTLGEMTLEDFLVKAGVVHGESSQSHNPIPQLLFNNSDTDPVFGLLDDPNGSSKISGEIGRRRIIDGPVEVVVERRHRRMIKNRESAARSRARKQAYTVELELELNKEREENTQLKQTLAAAERKMKQEV